MLSIVQDAHNHILNFDNGKSLFAVYDGHGGHEVAEYCSKYLPDYIKKEWLSDYIDNLHSYITRREETMGFKLHWCSELYNHID